MKVVCVTCVSSNIKKQKIKSKISRESRISLISCFAAAESREHAAAAFSVSLTFDGQAMKFWAILRLTGNKIE